MNLIWRKTEDGLESSKMKFDFHLREENDMFILDVFDSEKETDEAHVESIDFDTLIESLDYAEYYANKYY